MTGEIRVHASIWGIDREAERAALLHLTGGRWDGAARFDVRAVALLEPGVPCPLDPQGPGVLATRAGTGWVWVLHPPTEPPPMLPFEQDGCACVEGGEAP